MRSRNAVNQLQSLLYRDSRRQLNMNEKQKVQFHVFLSHNSKDKTVVRDLKKRLADKGLKVWLDEHELQPGIPWLPLLEQGIETSGSVAVLVGSDGFGPW